MDIIGLTKLLLAEGGIVYLVIGFPYVALAGLAYAYRRQSKDFQAERTECRSDLAQVHKDYAEVISDQHDKVIVAQKSATEAIHTLAAILQTLTDVMRRSPQ